MYGYPDERSDSRTFLCKFWHLSSIFRFNFRVHFKVADSRFLCILRTISSAGDHILPRGIDQFRYILKFSLKLPQSLVLRSIVWGWILIYRNRSIAFLSPFPTPLIYFLFKTDGLYFTGAIRLVPRVLSREEVKASWEGFIVSSSFDKSAISNPVLTTASSTLHRRNLKT